MATTANRALAGERFWQRMAIGLALFIFVAFAQFAFRGLADPVAAPIWVHLHALAMFGWLGLLVVQPRLAAAGNRTLHRQLGWTGTALATIIVGLGIFTGFAAVILHRQPPFFTAPYFLALTAIEAIAFGLLVYAAIRRRRATDWHRRLMLGATIIVLEPALGRVLPLPLMIGWSDIPIGLVELAVVGLIALHDRRTIGRVHPATIRVALAVVVTRIAVYSLALAPPVEELARRLGGG